ncbi:MAG TPA: hypothetical protein VIB00_00595, partial [Pyrinomonadaceae bacterium]
SKTWSFGSLPTSDGASRGGNQQRGGGGGGGGRGPGAGIPRVAGVGGGPGGGGGGPRGGGIPGIGGPGGGGEAKRYNMQFSINFNNLFNRVNLSTPNGSLSSPFFGQSLSLGGAFGGFGGGGFGGGGSGAGNRRVTAQVRFNF